jgi:hypothetical protein
MCTFVWLFAHGRFHRAQYHGLKALSIYRAAGLSHQWEYGFVQWMLLIQNWYAGEMKTLVEATKELRIQWQDNREVMWSFWIHTHSAHLADLIADRIVESRRAISIIDLEVQNQSFESPRFFQWISALRQELYEGNIAAAWRIKEKGWSLFIDSRLSSLTHYMWVANSLRLCCCLASSKANRDSKEMYLKEASTLCRRLRNIQEPLFALVAQAQELVVKAAQGKIAPRSRWAEVIEELRRSDMSLFSLAAAWHASIHWPGGDFLGDGTTAEQRFRDQGCVAPEKLMQVILPLP